MADLSGKRVAVIAGDYFEEAELTEPVKALREAGAEVEIISPKSGEIQAAKGDINKGQTIKVDRTLDEASPEDYDALILPGGAVNADKLRMDEKARDFVRKIFGQGKPTAVICHAPWMLVSAGLARGKKLTRFFTLQDDLRNAGADWMDEECVIDGNLITSRNPDDLPAFNQALISALAG